MPYVIEHYFCYVSCCSHPVSVSLYSSFISPIERISICSQSYSSTSQYHIQGCLDLLRKLLPTSPVTVGSFLWNLQYYIQGCPKLITHIIFHWSSHGCLSSISGHPLLLLAMIDVLSSSLPIGHLYGLPLLESDDAANLYTKYQQYPTLRTATLDDLDTVVDIGLTAMPLDPQWNYRFPKRQEYPIDHYDGIRSRYREFILNETGQWSVILAEVLNDKGSKTVVSFAVWNLGQRSPNNQFPIKHRNPLQKSRQLVRRDLNQKRANAWTETLRTSKKILFDGRFSNYIQLQILATHPKYQRLGAGTALCNDGIRAARMLRLPIAVFASPMGHKLYSQLGFTTLDTVTIQVKGEEENVVLTAMAYVSSKRSVARVLPR
jgi:GNAT superfamily N-acetyltransferase